VRTRPTHDLDRWPSRALNEARNEELGARYCLLLDIIRKSKMLNDNPTML
jgi:hypothetical protein